MEIVVGFNKNDLCTGKGRNTEKSEILYSGFYRAIYLNTGSICDRILMVSIEPVHQTDTFLSMLACSPLTENTNWVG